MQDCGMLSFFSPIGYQSGDCGYCKGEQTSASYYARSKSLCPRHYQELMDRGWRRSGALLYLPDASRSCCPHYTIRLPASELKPIRDQRQALHRWNRYVLGERYIKEASSKYPKSKEEKKHQKNTFDLMETVHESEYAKLKPGIEPDHRFEVTLEADTFTEEKFELFDNYQRRVHHENDGDISRMGFRRFLCSSPLHRHDLDGQNLGSFHQTYRLDGRLIAMSVLDIAPRAVSGVYFIYHSDFEKWSFGKLSALREAALAIEREHEWLYMGYYIHSCKKMRYKGDYKTQHVLDYDTGLWHPLDEQMQHLMDKRKWVSISREETLEVLSKTAQAPDTEGLADEMYAVNYPEPVSAVQSGLSAMQLDMPGVMEVEDLQREVNLDEMKAILRTGNIHEMQDLQTWADGSLLDTSTIKGIVAEFAACAGPVISRDAVLDFRSG